MSCPFHKLSAFNFIKSAKNIPDEVDVPENVLLAISHHDSYKQLIKDMFINLNAKVS